MGGLAVVGENLLDLTAMVETLPFRQRPHETLNKGTLVHGVAVSATARACSPIQTARATRAVGRATSRRATESWSSKTAMFMRGLSLPIASQRLIAFPPPHHPHRPSPHFNFVHVS